jgi:hypothetical protein
VLFESNLTKYKSTAARLNSPDVVKRNYDMLEKDVSRLIQIMSDGGVNLADQDYVKDFSDIRFYTSTMANTGNAVVDLFHQLFEQRSLLVKDAVMKDKVAFNKVFMPYINQQRALKGLGPLKHENDLKKYLSKTNTAEIYGKLYKEYEDDEGNKRKGLFRSDEDLNDPINDLTDIDKSLLNFLNNHYDTFFVGDNALLNKPYTYKLDFLKQEQTLSAIDVYNGNTYNSSMNERGSWNYTQQTQTNKSNGKRDVGWFPKFAPTMDEMLMMNSLITYKTDANGNQVIDKSFADYKLAELRQVKGMDRYLSKEY